MKLKAALFILFVCSCNPATRTQTGLPEHPLRINLTLTARQKGAVFSINGSRVGRSPVHLSNVPGGRLTVSCRVKGYHRWQTNLNLSHSSNLFVNLSPTNSRDRYYGRFHTGRHPKECKFTPDGRHIVATVLGDTNCSLTVFSFGSPARVRHIFFTNYGQHTGFVEGVFHKKKKEFWFSQMATGRIHICSWPDFKLLATRKSGGSWTKVVEFSPNGKRALISNWLSGTISEFSVAKRKLLRSIPARAKHPRGIAFSADTNFFYSVNFAGGAISKYSYRSGRLVKRTWTGGANGRIRMGTKRRYAYINNMAYGVIFIYDTRTDRIIKRIPTGINPNNVRLTPDGRYFYVACRGPNNPASYLLRSPRNGTIHLVSTKTLKEICRFEGGNQSVGLDVSRDNKWLIFSNLQDNTVEIYQRNYYPATQ